VSRGRSLLAFDFRPPKSNLPARMSHSGRGLLPMRTWLANAVPEPGDERDGNWLRDALERMNARFVARLERAIAIGSESASAVQATVVDPTSRMR
jgi:hypothetical protein